MIAQLCQITAGFQGLWHTPAGHHQLYHFHNVLSLGAHVCRILKTRILVPSLISTCHYSLSLTEYIGLDLESDRLTIDEAFTVSEPYRPFLRSVDAGHRNQLLKTLLILSNNWDNNSG